MEIVSYSLRGLTHASCRIILNRRQGKRWITTEEAAVRPHDITVCLETSSVPEFEQLSLLGRAVPLSSHDCGELYTLHHHVRDTVLVAVAIVWIRFWELRYCYQDVTASKQSGAILVVTCELVWRPKAF